MYENSIHALHGCPTGHTLTEVILKDWRKVQLGWIQVCPQDEVRAQPGGITYILQREASRAWPQLCSGVHVTVAVVLVWRGNYVVYLHRAQKIDHSE